jgi:hypothetical protein
MVGNAGCEHEAQEALAATGKLFPDVSRAPPFTPPRSIDPVPATRFQHLPAAQLGKIGYNGSNLTII